MIGLRRELISRDFHSVLDIFGPIVLFLSLTKQLSALLEQSWTFSMLIPFVGRPSPVIGLMGQIL